MTVFSQLAARLQRVVDALDHLVHREQRLGLVPVGARDLVDLGRDQLRQVPDGGRLVAHVGLVERRWPGERGVSYRPWWRGAGSIGTVVVPEVNSRCGAMRRHGEEERGGGGRPAFDEVDRVVGDDVGLVVGRPCRRTASPCRSGS